MKLNQSTLLADRAAVEAAVAPLQECLADGDPADAALRSHGESVLLALRAAYRVNPSTFSRESIEALRELNELQHENYPSEKAATAGKACGQELRGLPQP